MKELPTPWNFTFSNTFHACYLSELLRRLKHKHSVRICSTGVVGSVSDRVLWTVSFHRNQVSKHEQNRRIATIHLEYLFCGAERLYDRHQIGGDASQIVLRISHQTSQSNQ